MNFVGKVSMSSLWENSRIRDNNFLYNFKTLSVFFFALRSGWGESTFLGSEMYAMPRNEGTKKAPQIPYSPYDELVLQPSNPTVPEESLFLCRPVR